MPVGIGFDDGQHWHLHMRTDRLQVVSECIQIHHDTGGALAHGFAHDGRRLFVTANGIVRQIIKACVLTKEFQLEAAGGAVSVLADNDFGQAFVRRSLFVGAVSYTHLDVYKRQN